MVWDKIEEVARNHFIQGFGAMTKGLDVILRIMGSTSNPLAVLPSVPLKCIQNMTTAHPYTNTSTSFNQKVSGSNAAKKNTNKQFCCGQNGLWRGEYRIEVSDKRFFCGPDGR